jgi:small GTP-binding protein
MVSSATKSSKSTPKNIKRKILLLGDGAVGKTSLIRKFVLDKFNDKYIATIGTKVTKKELEISTEDEKFYVTLMIWDILGQKDYKSIQARSFKGADGVILVADFTREETLGSLEEYWLAVIANRIPSLQMVFVANKSDLKKEAQFTMKDLQKMAAKYDAEFFSSSAKTGENVEKLFITLGKKLIEEKEEVAQEQMRPAAEEEEMTLVLVTDKIINDFCDNFGNLELAMPIIRRQFSEANVDIRKPTSKGLLRVIDLLAKVEQGYKDAATVNQNKIKRRLLVQKVKD